MFRKRVLALLLAFTFIIGYIPNLGLMNVLAAEMPLNIWSDKTLTLGNNNDTPVYNSTGQTQNEFMFDWDVSKKDETNTLEYWVDSNKKIVVTTTSVGEMDLYVDIYLEDSAGNKIDVMNPKYSIYSNYTKSYVTVDNFFGALSGAYNSYEEKEVIDDNTAVNDRSKMASFRLTKGDLDVGYSFKYADFEFHFLLNKDGLFRFYQVGDFEEGNVYKATFTKAGKPYERYFSIGLNLNSVVTEPFVDVDGLESQREEKDDKYKIEERNSVSVDDDDEVGFVYKVPLPNEYDNGGSNEFDKALTKDATYKIEFFKGSTNTSERYISIDVTVPSGNGTPTVTSTPIFQKGSYGTITIETDAEGNKLLVVPFLGLDSGMLLTPEINFGLESSAESVIKNYGTPKQKAYTFPQYEIINNDGQDYVSITPFAGYKGDYVLFSATCKGGTTVNRTDMKFASEYFKSNAQSTDKIWLPLSPVPTTGDATYDYKIFFNPNEPFENAENLAQNPNAYNRTIQTRYFEYTSKDRGTIGFPNDFEIKNTNQSKMFKPDVNYPNEGSGNYVEDFQDVSYTLGWDLGRVTSIDKMLTSGAAINTTGSAIVSYDINIGTEVDVVDTFEDESPFLNIVFNLEGSAAGQAILTSYDYEFGRNGTNPKDPLNRVIDARLSTVYSAQSSAYIYRLEIDIENVAIDSIKKAGKPEYASIVNNLYFEYPNIYFFTVSPKIGSGSGSVISTVKSLTLNKDTAVDLKEPVNVKADNMVTQFKGETNEAGQYVTKDQVSIDLSYEQQQATLAELMKYYFTSYDLEHYGQNMLLTNDIYISQDYDKMSDTIPDYSTKEQRDAITTEFIFDGSVDENGNYQVMMKNFANNDLGTDPAALTSADGKLGVDVLRAGGIVRISDVPMTVKDTDGSYSLPTSNLLNTLRINGLDTNAKYYFYVDSNVIYESNGVYHRYLDQTLNEDYILEDSSGISALASGTTGSSLATPNILDEVPLMPDISLIETGRNNYEMTWEKVDMTIADTTRYSQEFKYEVLRIRDTKLEDKYLDSRQDLQQVFTNQIPSTITDKSAQLLYQDKDTGKAAVKVYNPATNNFDVPENGLYMQSYDDNSIIYEDNSLSANKVYFIYARTVRVITEKDPVTGDVIGTYNVYSAWDTLSATTVLGDAPIDLKVVYNYPTAYNEQTSIPLSFRAKVPNLNDIGKDFTFEVTYKYDDIEWVKPITIDSQTLINSATEVDAEGYRTFTFLLTGLKPGKTYSIKVRQANEDGSYTPYSNTVQWKTEIDEDEYDKEDEVDAFEDLMDDLVDRLIDGSQVELVNNDKEKVVMINGNNLSNEISGSKANTILIDSLDKGKKNTLIIPFEAYETANDKKLGWQFSYDDMFFNMSAKSIDPTYNTNVISINKKVERDLVDDYYMEVIFEYKSTPLTLQGDQRLTDVVTVGSKLRATTENVLDFQEAALKEALEEAKNSSGAIAKKENVLSRIANNNISSEEALKLVDEYVAYVNELFKSSFNSKLLAIRQTRDDETVSKLDKNMIMGTNYQNVLSQVTAYSVNTSGVALPMSTTRSTNVTTAVVKDFGTYGFGGDAVNIVGTIDNQNGNNNVSEIIAKNDLEDTLSDVSNNVNTSSNITVSQALVAMSNITGMTETEMKTVLSNKGVAINRNNESKELTEDLSAAMLGVLYEEVNGVNPDTVTIKDYNFYNSLTSSSINKGYIKHIQVAKEMGLISSVPSTSKKVTVGTFLGILSKI